MSWDIRPEDIIKFRRKMDTYDHNGVVLAVFSSYAKIAQYPYCVRKVEPVTLTLGVDWWRVVERDGVKIKAEQPKHEETEAAAVAEEHGCDDTEDDAREEGTAGRRPQKDRTTHARSCRGPQSKKGKTVPRRRRK